LPTDLAERFGRPAEVFKRLVVASGRMQQVGQVVLNGALGVPIADPPA
jgi:hypothetical protein